MIFWQQSDTKIQKYAQPRGRIRFDLEIIFFTATFILSFSIFN